MLRQELKVVYFAKTHRLFMDRVRKHRGNILSEVGPPYLRYCLEEDYDQHCGIERLNTDGLTFIVTVREHCRTPPRVRAVRTHRLPHRIINTAALGIRASWHRTDCHIITLLITRYSPIAVVGV